MGVANRIKEYSELINDEVYLPLGVGLLGLGTILGALIGPALFSLMGLGLLSMAIGFAKEEQKSKD